MLYPVFKGQRKSLKGGWLFRDILTFTTLRFKSFMSQMFLHIICMISKYLINYKYVVLLGLGINLLGGI